MRKIFLLTAFTCLFTAVCHAQKKYEMVVEKTDGSNIVVNTEDIIRTYFRERTGGGNNDPLQSYTKCPDDNHPHLIDLGLPSGTKWACCNVGANMPERPGGFYAWGETEEKEVYDWSTYIHCDGSMETCHDLGENIAGTQYDVA